MILRAGRGFVDCHSTWITCDHITLITMHHVRQLEGPTSRHNPPATSFKRFVQTFTFKFPGRPTKRKEAGTTPTKVSFAFVPEGMSITLHTTLGDIKIEVFCDTAPRTSENFLAHCASGYYDGTKFHRNIKGFMVQGGDPLGTGKGGESIWGGPFPDEFHPDNKHDRRGVVSMASKGPNTNKSQFFITYTRQPHLNNVYTVFGKVIDGLDVLDVIEKAPVGKKERPTTDIVVKDITIHANPIAENG